MFKQLTVFIVVLLAITQAKAAVVALNPDLDTVVATGPSNNFINNNYGGAGATSVAGASTSKGEQRTVTRFDVSTAASAFNTEFGAGNWAVDSVVLRLTAQVPGGANPLFNNPNVAGQFIIDWVSVDSWVEGTGNPNTPTASGLTWATLNLGTAQSQGTQGYNGSTGAVDYLLTPSAGLLADIMSGGYASFMLRASDPTMSAIFNSRSNGTTANWPVLTITASAVPEPGRMALLMLGMTALLARRKRSFSLPT